MLSPSKSERLLVSVFRLHSILPLGLAVPMSSSNLTCARVLKSVALSLLRRGAGTATLIYFPLLLSRPELVSEL